MIVRVWLMNNLRRVKMKLFDYYHKRKVYSHEWGESPSYVDIEKNDEWVIDVCVKIVPVQKTQHFSKTLQINDKQINNQQIYHQTSNLLPLRICEYGILRFDQDWWQCNT